VTELLVVAGEASGDRAGAAVIHRLREGGRAIEAFGIGGGALEREGVELLADLRDLTAMGVAEVARRAGNVAVAYTRVRAAIARRRPAAALLVNYTEFNARLAESLWSSGTRVLWYGAPQIWAWRRGRGAPLGKHLDRMAVMLPFEENVWRELGVDAHYVGHPALEERRDPVAGRVPARELLGMTPFAPAVAILPGSRPHEVRRLLEPMLAGYEEVREDRASLDARVLLAPSLDARTRDWARALTDKFDIDLVDIDPRAGLAYSLPAFDVALCASGTASLECVLANAIPVVCYRVGWAAELGARAFMTTKQVALPNILLGREVFPELLQKNATAQRMSDALADVLDRRDALLGACSDVIAALGATKTSASVEVARMLRPWLE
jgi:lipid-A-disaccharide synthase